MGDAVLSSYYASDSNSDGILPILSRFVYIPMSTNLFYTSIFYSVYFSISYICVFYSKIEPLTPSPGKFVCY